MLDEAFYTFREYMKKEGSLLTASMEDYLEMVYRLSEKENYTRISELANALNVQPPSATKMIQKLSDCNLISYKRYGIILLTEQGIQLGKALMYRHNMIKSFLLLIGLDHDLLEETEKIEHTMGINTLKCLDDFIHYLNAHPQILDDFQSSRKSNNSNVI